MPGLPNPYVIIGALVGAILLAVGAFYEGFHYKSLQDAATLAAAENNVIIQNHSQDVITADVVKEAAISQLQIASTTQTELVEVPRYVSIQADSRCVVPVGFVRLHDAAAGMPVLPDGTGQSDDTDSGVSISTVASTVVSNYGQCRQTADQLTRLQNWIIQEEASVNKFEGQKP